MGAALSVTQIIVVHAEVFVLKWWNTLLKDLKRGGSQTKTVLKRT
jgi:hypothetical protein|tara:strand:+ start:1579 stop:1713 length:135 start_codon:yes stop_codon:yes gene_type:complete